MFGLTNIILEINQMTSTIVNNDDQIATCIDGKFFWHNKGVDLKELCSNIPNREGRTIFSVTLFEPFLFYHDRDLALKRSQPFVVKLLNSLTSDEKASDSNEIVEYLVTRNPTCPTKCKFERLGPENESSAKKSHKIKEEKDDKKESPESEKTKPSNDGTNSKTWTINTWLQGNLRP